MLDMAWAGLFGADETQAAQDGPRPRYGGGGPFRTQTILHHHHHTVRLEQRRKQVRQQVVLGGLERDKDDIALGHLARVAIGPDLRQPKIAVLGFDLPAMLPNVFVIAAHQKMNLAPGPLQTRPVKHAQRPSANDRISSLFLHAGENTLLRTQAQPVGEIRG